MIDAVWGASAAVHRTARNKPAVAAMGTTLCAALAEGGGRPKAVFYFGRVPSVVGGRLGASGCCLGKGWALNKSISNAQSTRSVS